MVFERIVNLPSGAEDEEISLSVGISGESTSSNLCFLFLHGAGSSKYTWHHQISQFSPSYLCLVPDLRGHGESSSCDSLSLTHLVSDLIHLINQLQTIIGTRSLVLICHSVGGAIGTKFSELNPLPNHQIVAIIVLDLVEGTALASLPHMKTALESWPSQFNEINEGILFSVNQHRPQSIYSAHISIPSLLIPDTLSPDTATPVINERGFSTTVYRWKTPLLKYESDWIGWFEGFNNTFLSLPFPHCLIVATIERLDGPMSVAQMQGKFEVHVTHGGEGGHFIQEDNPGELLGIIVRFLLGRGIVTSDEATRLLTSGLTSVAVGGTPSRGGGGGGGGFLGSLPPPHIYRGVGGGGESYERYRSPFPKGFS
jgi:protein phosphatase methylesterase 1